MQGTHKHSQHMKVTQPVLSNDRVFVSEPSRCAFGSSCTHLNFRFRTCFGERGNNVTKNVYSL